MPRVARRWAARVGAVCPLPHVSKVAVWASTGYAPAMPSPRRTLHEVWSLDADGQPHKHGAALGLTFQDACKQLASESVDFWTHYDKGRYQGRPLYRSREDLMSKPASAG